MLQALDPAAFRRLGTAFRSPYFTNSPLLLQLYELLKKAYPDFKESRLQKEQVFQKLYPGQPFNDGALRVLVREFTKITEDFVLFETLKNDETTRQKMLIKWYGEHDLYAEFVKGTQALLAKLEAEPYRDVEYFSDTAQLYFDLFFHPLTNRYTLDDQSFTQGIDNIDRRYILFKLRMAGEAKNRERILSKQYGLRLLDEALAIGGSELLEDNTAFQLYRTLLKLYEPDHDPAIFQTLKAALVEQMGQLRFFDQSMLLMQVTNYAVRQLNQGNAAFNTELFSLFQLALSYDLVVTNGKIESSVFRNIAAVGSAEKAFEWTENFIWEHEQFLDPDIRQDEKTMAMALLYFHKADYDKAIELIAQHQFSNELLKLNTRTTLARAWFEKFVQDRGYYDLLIYQLEAIEKFMRRSKLVSRARKADHLNFIVATRHLAELIHKKTPAPEIRSRLGKFLEPNQRVASRSWLMLKIDQYERNG